MPEDPKGGQKKRQARLLVLRRAGMTLQECSTVLERSYSGTQVQAAKPRMEAQSTPKAWEDAIPQSGVTPMKASTVIATVKS